MTSIDLVALLLLVWLIAWTVRARRRSVDPLLTLKQFGPSSKSPRPLRKEEREALFHAAVWQQKTAFGLLVLAVATGVVLGGVLLGRIILAPELDLDMLGRATALMGGLAFCQYASRLNKDASARVASIVKVITGS